MVSTALPKSPIRMSKNAAKIEAKPFRPSRTLLLRMGLARTRSAPGLDCYGVLNEDDTNYFDWTLSVNHDTHEFRVRTWNHGQHENVNGYWEQLFRGSVETEEAFFTTLRQVGWPL